MSGHPNNVAASFVKRAVKRLINGAGFEVHRLHPGLNPAFQLLKTLQRFEVDLVFDVGANVGQFSTELRSVGYKDVLVSFEPLSAAHALLSQAARGDARWIVHPRCAIGDRDGEVEINIAGNSVSSSLLPMMESHLAAAEDSAYIGLERVQIARLDTVAAEYFQLGRRPFLKIDTQGYEWQVLDGAQDTLAFFRGIRCELSLVPLYETQRLWEEMVDRLQHAGFTLWSMDKGFVDPRDGRSLQLDATFIRL